MNWFHNILKLKREENIYEITVGLWKEILWIFVKSKKKRNKKIMSGQNLKSSVDNSGITYDHHGYKLDDPTLKGFHRYYNNSTIRGRANVAATTIGLIFGFIIFNKARKLFGKSNEENPLDKVKVLNWVCRWKWVKREMKHDEEKVLWPLKKTKTKKK